ncbi:MAG TPA: TIR domain-containing protein, partial [Kofleriaceae bacterium]|nr:TIR domain-containing protein [Kofleriaceae bacterium]
AMANVAWILASNGHRVVVIDWDLEAPGLHRFLGPALPDPGQKATAGLIDFLMEYVLAATRGRGAPASEPWYEPYTNIMRFVQPVNTGFAEGRLDMIGAGRQNAEYAERVNMFDWRSFYERFQGRAFLDAVFAKLRDRYDFILLDSRTGVSDTSGVCTVHLPDALVVMFTMNTQSIEGASGVALDARRQRDNKLEVYPVPTRIELAELDRLQAARMVARQCFEPLVKDLDSPKTDYLEDMEVPHVAYYLYEEQLAAIVEGGRARVLLAIYERITAYVSKTTVTRLKLLPEKELDAARARFRTGKAPGSSTSKPARAPKRYDVYLTYALKDEAMGRSLRDELRNLMSVFAPLQDIKPGQAIADATRDAIASSAAVVVVFSDTAGAATPSWVEAELAQARELDVPVIPVLLGNAQAPESIRDVLVIRGRASEPGNIAAQVRAATLANDHDGRNASERIAILYAERNKLQADARRFRLVILAGLGVILIVTVLGTRQIFHTQDVEVNAARLDSQLRDTKLVLQAAQSNYDTLDRNTKEKNAALAKQLQTLEVQFQQAGDRIAELQRTQALPADATLVVKQAAASQDALHLSVRDVAKQIGPVKPIAVQPMVLVFAPPGDTEARGVQTAANTLEKAGYALGSKRVFALQPPKGVTEVRYFRPDDRAKAEEILSTLKANTELTAGRVSYVIDPDIKRPLYFEVHTTKTAFTPKATPRQQPYIPQRH